eukprot:GFYU01009899.1.p1 GENE.GFYU01009899.1~~GFYU01009899.1.p1  ORF type:complete len:244 (-),score=45.11 GFYU01009899.1:127-858(-)
MSSGLKALVVGSTGGVGQRIVYYLAHDPRVDVVTCLARSEGGTAQKYGLKSPQADKVKFAVVDYEVLAGEDSDQKEAMRKLLHGHDIGFSGLGLYTSAARNEEHFRHVEIDLNMGAVDAFVRGGGTRFSYLSGQGAKEGGWMMFARVKADAEKAIRETPGLQTGTAARPAGIANRQGKAIGYDGLNNFFHKIPGLNHWTIDADDIAKGMIHSCLAEPGEVPHVYENSDLKVAARMYEQSVPKS